MGLVLSRLFMPEASGSARPSLRAALLDPSIAYEPLSNLGIDSLAWLELVTQLEAELGLPLDNDFLQQDAVSAYSLGEAIARSLSNTGTPTAV